MATRSGLIDRLRGPRVPPDELAARREQFLRPTVLLGLAGLLLLVSIFLPYWRLKLNAPQYPGGLHVKAYVNHLTGDVKEIDGLNHYIGMRPLGDAAQLERSLSVIAVIVLGLLILAAIYVHNRNAAFFTLPALLFPGIFLGDLYYWLQDFGTNLDPNAPLSSSVDPFVPAILGKGEIGQFSTFAMVDAGFWLAILASALIVAGLYYHRQAYKPLVDAQANGEA